MTFSKRKLGSLVNSLRCFLKFFHKASLRTPLRKTVIEIESTKSGDNIFALYYKDIIERSNRQIRLSFFSENSSFCIIFIRMFELQGSQVLPSEIVNFIRRGIYHLCENRFYIAKKW